MPLIPPAVDRNTKRLLDLEQRLEAADEEGLLVLQAEIHDLLVDQRSVLTSSELDFFLQLAMLFLAARLGSLLGPARGQRYKIALLVHSADHGVMVIKPLFYSSGGCVAIQPTVAIDPAAPNGGRDTRIGQTGVSLLTGEFIYCSQFEACGVPTCPQYITIEGAAGLPTMSSLCIPILHDMRKRAQEFSAKLGEAMRCSREHTCSPPSLGEELERGSRLPIGVLNLESDGPRFDTASCKRFLADRGVLDVLERIRQALKKHQQDRDRYKTLKTCASLFDLSQHNLVRRQAYEALLEEISALAGDADATLHIRELRSERDRFRAVRLVEGVGANFRGFLINDRQSLEHGLIGKAFRGRAVHYPAATIDELSAVGSPEYKQLMPATRLNLAVPVPEADDPDRVAGVVNIEWDERSLAGQRRPDETVEAFIARKSPALQRAAQYFSLAINHFNVDEGTDGAAKPPALDELRDESDRRVSLSYYVAEVVETVDKLAKEGNLAAVESLGFLQEIIDAAGYHLSFDRPIQFILTLNRLATRDGGAVLELVGRPHGGRWLGAPPAIRPLQLTAESVIALAARRRAPVFGEVRDGWLHPDPPLGGDAPAAAGPVRYLDVGGGGFHAVYEVAVPILFGDELYGVLDFEQFLRAKPEPSWREQHLPGLRLTPKQLDGFLEWVDAIAFCIAYADDLLHVLRLDEHERTAFDSLRRLVAQIVANVQLPAKTAQSLATKYLHQLTSVDLRRVHPLRQDGEPEAGEDEPPSFAIEAGDLTYPMRHRGYLRGLVEFTPLSDAEPPNDSLFPGGRQSETVEMVLRFFSAYQTAVSLSTKLVDEPDDSFVRWLDTARDALEREAELVPADADPGTFIEQLFDRVHGALGLGLSERYGWYLYGCRFDGERGMTVLTPGPPGRRRISMNTREMRGLLKSIERDGGGLAGLARMMASGQLIGREHFRRAFAGPEPDLEALRAVLEERYRLALPHLRPDEATLRAVLVEILGDEPYEAPSAERPPETSITLRAWAQGEVLSFPDIARNPYRADHAALDWLFRKASYAIISVPLRLAERTVGVLNLLRRRDRYDDANFFKGNEVEHARRFGQWIDERLAEGLEVLPLRAVPRPLPAPVERVAEHGPALHKIVERLAGLIAEAGRRLPHEPPEVVLVVTPFAEHPVQLEEIVRPILPDSAWAYSSDPELGWEALRDRVPGRPVAVFYPLENADSDRLFERLLLDLLGARPSLLVLVVSEERRADLEQVIPKRLNLRATLEHVERLEENWAFFREHFGWPVAEADAPPALVSVLLRRGENPWNLERFKELCAAEGVSIKARWQRFIHLERQGGGNRPSRDLLVFDRAIGSR